jgi:hypothetical protein
MTGRAVVIRPDLLEVLAEPACNRRHPGLCHAPGHGEEANYTEALGRAVEECAGRPWSSTSTPLTPIRHLIWISRLPDK